METNAVTSGNIGTVSSAAATQPANVGSGGELGQDAFLKLLVAQLRYQNPLQPSDSLQFVTQLAQFSMLSELQAIHQRLDELAAQVQAGSTYAAAADAAVDGAKEVETK